MSILPPVGRELVKEGIISFCTACNLSGNGEHPIYHLADKVDFDTFGETYLEASKKASNNG
jgi:hypothetical protein